jgi:hypothetical protein
MSINTQGATNVSLNTAATYVSASVKSIRTVGGKTFPRYDTASGSMGTMLQSTSLYQVILNSSNLAKGTVNINYPFSIGGQGAGSAYFTISKSYAYVTIQAVSIYPAYFDHWAITSGGATAILTGGTKFGANQPYGTAASPIIYNYNFTTADAATYTTVYAVFI